MKDLFRIDMIVSCKQKGFLSYKLLISLKIPAKLFSLFLSVCHDLSIYFSLGGIIYFNP